MDADVGLDADDDDAPSWSSDFERLFADFRFRFGRNPAVLDWHVGFALGAHFPELAIFAPPTDSREAGLPYLSRSIDVVVVAFPDAATLAEARRVAIGAVAALRDKDERDDQGVDRAEDDVGDGADLVLDVEWQPGSTPLAPRTTSIIIPTYNGIALTEACLAALQRTLPSDFWVEIVVVDDGSTDGTWDVVTRLAEQDDRIKPLRNDTNRGFIDASNRGASIAEGEILLFLNNDTEPVAGWLPPLLETFRDHPDVGAVGGKLVYPSGRLQEAGGVVFRDGSGANFGRGDDPDHPLFNYVRDVDYCSGAVLATKRSLFHEIGGFDTRYRPAYYEDTDYCMAVRQHGLRVLYQPDCKVIHDESARSGKDVRLGTKGHQASNQRTFIEKWETTLADHPLPAGRYDRRTWYALAVRGGAAGSVR
jgi:GT2 family glycosyltransferase